MTGVDLGFVPVVRMPDVGTKAASLDARAYTHAGVVHLPESAGPIDSAANEALIAHELAHVAQQRALGPRAAEDGPLGDALEAQAQAVERAHLGHPVQSWELDWPEGAELPSGGMTWTLEDGFQPIGPSGGFPGARYPGSGYPGSGLPGGHGSGELPGELPGFAESAFDGAARPQRAGEAPPPPIPPGLPWFPHLPNDDGSDEGIQPLQFPQDRDEAEVEESGETGQGQQPLSEEEINRVAERVRAGIMTPRLDLEDPEMLDALARGLYGRLRSSLRSELISDRERSGMLTEFH
jgi:hypothetical protein